MLFPNLPNRGFRVGGLPLVVVLLAAPFVARAQLSGNLEGAVTDPSNQTVVGAQIRITETTTNTERRLITDREGRYTAAELPPGTYRVEASSPGFQPAEIVGLALTAGITLRADFRLKIGAARESISVIASAQQIDTSAGAWGNSISEQQLASLPLNGRDIFELASQQIDVIAPASATQAIDAGLGVHFSINGSRPSENAFRLDGIYINDSTGSAPASAAGYFLGLEAIAELRVISSPFSAEYGRSDGGTITAVTKSGTNSFHGGAYEYLRNSAFDGKNFFDQANDPIPGLRQNQFGGLLDGPILKDRLFFFLNYEGIRISSSQTQASATPNQQARDGLLPVNGVLTSVPVAAAMLPYLSLYPLPNGPNLGNGTGEFITAVPSLTSEDSASAKLDYVHSERLRFSGRYTYDTSYQNNGDPLKVWTYENDSHYSLFQGTAQYVQSATLIQDFRAAFSQIGNGEIATVPAPVSAQLAFIPGQRIGAIQVTGLANFGGNFARSTPQHYTNTDEQFSYSVTKIAGIHKISAGGSYDRILLNELLDVDRDGYYQFSSLQGFLDGKTKSLSAMTLPSDTLRHWRMNQFSAYAQDDIRLTRRLSAGVGVRYEPASVPVERNGLVASLHNPLADTQIALGGPLYMNPSKLNFAPRASLAWDVRGDGQMVIRAGAGIFYDLLGTRELVISGANMPPFYEKVTVSKAAFPNAVTALQNVTQLVNVEDLAFYPHQPYVAQYQFVIERKLARNATAQIGYAGSRGIHLEGDIGNINTTRPEFLANGQIYFPPNTATLNPAFGQIGYRTPSFDSNYNSLNMGVEAQAFKGMRIQAKFTWSKSIDDDSITTHEDFYTSEKVPTVFDFRANRGRSDFDTPLAFAANFSYDVPSTPWRAANRFLGGWELRGLAQAQSGNPFNPTVGFDDARLEGSSDSGQRPNLVPGQPLITGNPAQYFNPLAFSLPPAGYYGNLGRNVLTGPGLVIASAALQRIFRRKESQILVLRAEVFNIANHPNFQIPSGTELFDSTGARLGTAGQITTTTTSSRQIQVSARLAF
jgi:Carboxypeptidase regulatory-like domain